MYSRYHGAAICNYAAGDIHMALFWRSKSVKMFLRCYGSDSPVAIRAIEAMGT